MPLEEVWGEKSEKAVEEQPTCPFCLGKFADEVKLREHAKEHSVLDIHKSLEASLGTKLSGALSGVGNQMGQVIGEIGKRISRMEERLQRVEPEGGKPAEPEKPSPPEEVLMGDEGREARIQANAAVQATEALRSRGYGADDISKVLGSIGAFLGGAGPLVAALRPVPVRSPFEDAGRAMFTAFAEAMTRSVARVVGREVGEQAVRREHE